MFGTLKGRILTILAVVAASIAFLVINGITLGLDLRGGMYLALEVDDPPDVGRVLRAERVLHVLANRVEFICDLVDVRGAQMQVAGDIGDRHRRFLW